jgi:Cof subfamily protein (haloacid dehalogenase superfamily)
VSDPVRLVLSDVDGTLVTTEKVLTERSIRAVDRLRDAGILFALTSARPPQGLAMFIEPLGITTPLGAFNGGLMADVDLKVLAEKTIEDELVQPIVELLEAHAMSVWVYQGPDWYVRDMHGPHVEHESRTCECEPDVLSDFDGLVTAITKIVGVSDDPAAGAATFAAMKGALGSRVLATRSQSYFIDVTNPGASKGEVVKYLSSMYDVAPAEVATIGDMHNDLSMFAVSGLSIAMGNADHEVQGAATKVTTSNDDEGFANAIEKFILA